ncbi:hypothetical protein QE430_003325 [Microbacterium testaceum]|uniref:hypothetical protein n=1 Tax=Microbacterium testaceum TaxID=2033 RepID=UPI00277EF298|nr:hypothetical protein [Microbacterium testaceum]MDQ1175018.1 hypothetical protein [Microbacterium testaceum]
MSNEVEKKSNVEKLARAITQAGRHGLKRSSSFDPGVELAVEASTVLVTAAIVEQAISDLSPEPLQEQVRTLLRSRSESVQDLKPASLLKLRAILYLGLGEAQYVHSGERRESLVRTYTAYVPVGKPAPRGVEAFRVGKNNLSRAEREDLARLIAETVLDKLSKLQVSEDANFDSRFETTPHANDGDAFAIVKYVDQHVYPARGEGTMVVRRTRKLRALRDGVDSFTAHYATLSRTGPEWHPRITGFGDLTVSNVRKQAVDERTGVHVRRSHPFPRPLSR